MVAVIIVTYNAASWIEKCIDSIKNSTCSVVVFVIDNGSSDCTQSIIRNKYPTIELIELKYNIGFGKANNIGFIRALEINCEYIFLVNQDAWVQPETIEKLIRFHQENKEYGILSPLHLSGDGADLDKNFSVYINGKSCPGLISDIILHKEKKPIYEIDFVNAALWLISKEVLEKVGGFDPLFFMYGEDRDYIQRLKTKGFKVGICPSTIGYHDRIQNVNETNNRISFERLYSSRLVLLKDLSKPLPSKYTLYLSIFLFKIKSIVFKDSHSIDIKILRKVCENYEAIIQHRNNCRISGRTFLKSEDSY